MCSYNGQCSNPTDHENGKFKGGICRKDCRKWKVNHGFLHLCGPTPIKKCKGFSNGSACLTHDQCTSNRCTDEKCVSK